MLKPLSELNLGESATIESFSDLSLSLKILEMGCTPGEIVKLIRVAPAGDPIAIEIDGYVLSLRKKEAATVKVKLIA
jgi:ferrous iron transport protein A